MCSPPTALITVALTSLNWPTVANRKRGQPPGRTTAPTIMTQCTSTVDLPSSEVIPEHWPGESRISPASSTQAFDRADNLAAEATAGHVGLTAPSRCLSAWVDAVVPGGPRGARLRGVDAASAASPTPARCSWRPRAVTGCDRKSWWSASEWVVVGWVKGTSHSPRPLPLAASRLTDLAARNATSHRQDRARGRRRAGRTRSRPLTALDRRHLAAAIEESRKDAETAETALQ